MLVYGKNVALSFLEESKNVRKAILQEGFADEKILSLLHKKKISTEYVDKTKISELASGNHQGIILDVEDFRYSDLDDIITSDNSIIVLLDHLEDPHNLGAIIRTSEAAGVSGIIIPKDRSVSVNSTVMKTSVGAVNNIPICMVTNLKQTLDRLKKEGYWVVGTDMTNSVDYRNLDYKGKVVLVIGNEGSGISNLIKKECDFMAKIPMYGKVNSLNASVAAAIMIYEAVRQQKG